jgi:hypothetical protein
MLGAATALDATVGLEGDDLGDVFAGGKAEIFDVVVGGEWRDGGEAFALEEDGKWREDQVEMFGVGDEREKDQQSQGVRPPQGLEGGLVTNEEGGQIRDHQEEDEARDDARLVGDFSA